jgi:hypothetical protein
LWTTTLPSFCTFSWNAPLPTTFEDQNAPWA